MTSPRTTQACASLEGKEPSATTPCGTLCVLGPNVVALGQNEKGQACCCLNPPHGISNSDRRPADVYTFRLLPGLPLHATLLWQPCAGRRLGASKSEGGCGGGHCLRPTQGLLPSDGAGLGHKEYSSYPWSSKAPGAWDPTAMNILKRIAHAVAARTGADPAAALSLLHQEACVCVRSWRARAKDDGPELGARCCFTNDG